MEFTKTEKIDLGSIAVRSTGRSALTTRLSALEPGEAFIVTGVDREQIAAKLSPLRRDGRSFITNKLDLQRYRVTRVR